jgi:hypothetical protein
MVHLLRPCRCAMAMAEQIDGRREPQALTAGVFEATDDGVSCGVGSGPMRGSAGGSISGLGSKKRGSKAIGVGVVSDDIDSNCIAFEVAVVGVGVVGDAMP